MESHKFRLFEQLINLNESDRPVAVSDFCGARIGEHIHAESFCNFGDRLAYLAVADDADGFALELGQRGLPETEVRAVAPFAAVDRFAVQRNAVGVFKNEREHELSHRRGAVARHV